MYQCGIRAHLLSASPLSKYHVLVVLHPGLGPCTAAATVACSATCTQIHMSALMALTCWCIINRKRPLKVDFCKQHEQQSDKRKQHVPSCVQWYSSTTNLASATATQPPSPPAVCSRKGCSVNVEAAFKGKWPCRLLMCYISQALHLRLHPYTGCIEAYEFENQGISSSTKLVLLFSGCSTAVVFVKVSKLQLAAALVQHVVRICLVSDLP